MATEQRIPPAITDEAARWITDRDTGLLTADDERALADWLAADPLHALAYSRAEKLWRALGTPSVKAEVRQRRVGLLAVLRPPMPARRWAGGALAACIALAVIGGVNDWPTRMRADAMTATGEGRVVTLTDGSIVQLNTGSAVAVEYRADRRVVRLLKGEAAFTVKADATRPFTVEAGDGATTALGTRFVVRRDGEDTAVIVTEHSVRVAWPLEQAGKAATLAEGQEARYGPHGLTAPETVDADAATAWTRGRLVFVDRPLAEVVAELNRYHPGYFRIVGADLGQRRVSGIFRTDDPVRALDALQRSLGVGSFRITDRLIFIHA